MLKGTLAFVFKRSRHQAILLDRKHKVLLALDDELHVFLGGEPDVGQDVLELDRILQADFEDISKVLVLVHA